MTCISGPPCTPGKSVESICLANFSWHSTMPPRGPRKLLCVVVVTNCACGIGLGCWQPRKIDDARVGRRAGGDHDRPHLLGLFLQRVVIDRLGLRVHAVMGDLIKFAGKICGMSVREMSAVREIHR